MENCTFSILMTARNAHNTLRDALDSVLEQDYQNWELIVLDNGSSDDTWDIIEEYSKKDSRIVGEKKEKSIGWPKGTSVLLKKASGTYMVFLAADDMFLSEKALSVVAGVADEQSNPDIIIIGYAKILNNEVYYPEDYSKKNNIYLKMAEKRLSKIAYIMDETYYNSLFHFEKIEFLRENNIDFFDPFYADCAGMTEALAKAKDVYILNQPMYGLRIETSQTRGTACLETYYITQWRSIKSLIANEGEEENASFIKYIANRILINACAVVKNICDGVPIIDREMNRVELSNQERAEFVLSIIKDRDFMDMVLHGNTQECTENIGYSLKLLESRL